MNQLESKYAVGEVVSYKPEVLGQRPFYAEVIAIKFDGSLVKYQMSDRPTERCSSGYEEHWVPESRVTQKYTAQ